VVEPVASAYAHRAAGPASRIVYVERRDRWAFAVVDLGNDDDSMRFGSVLCQQRGRGWGVVPEPVQWYRHGQTFCEHGIAQLIPDFVEPGTSSVTLTDGSVLRPIAGRLFRVHWLLCYDSAAEPLPLVESIRIDGHDRPPLVPTSPATGDYVLDLAVDCYRPHSDPASDRHIWGQNVRLDAPHADFLRAGLDRLRREDDAEVRSYIACG
jgi:hypothetical protein